MLVPYHITLRQGVWRQHVPRVGREQFAMVGLHSVYES